MTAFLSTIWGTRKHRGGRTSSAGFTILELMITVGVLATVAGVAFPQYQAYRKKIELKRAAFQISGELYEAKAQAIRTRVNCSVNFTTTLGAQSYTLLTPNSSGIPTLLFDFGGSIQYANNPDGGTDVFSTTIVFRPNGTTTSLNPRQVYVRSVNVVATGPVNIALYRVQVMPTGAVAIARWDAQNNVWDQ